VRPHRGLAAIPGDASVLTSNNRNPLELREAGPAPRSPRLRRYPLKINHERLAIVGTASRGPPDRESCWALDEAVAVDVEFAGLLELPAWLPDCSPEIAHVPYFSPVFNVDLVQRYATGED
jgi:hypothetical protein